MFQDIIPHKLNSEYHRYKPEDNDFVIAHNQNQLLINEKSKLIFPSVSDVKQQYPDININLFIYLFDIDGKKFFFTPESLSETYNLKYRNVRSFRDYEPQWVYFCGATAVHFSGWYQSNRFCGKCGSKMMAKDDERALYCPDCNQIVYPRINPVVIVGVTDGDKILLTKNENVEYKGYALISGFMEVGETLEDTVRREVMEEVGLNVKNMHYYKSQPWAFSESILVGFFAEVDGNTIPFLDGKELTEATWCERKDLPADNSCFSLTWDMIENFRLGNV